MLLDATYRDIALLLPSTPSWQKPITAFFKTTSLSAMQGSLPSSSRASFSNEHVAGPFCIATPTSHREFARARARMHVCSNATDPAADKGPGKLGPRYVANGKTTYQPLYKGNVQGGRGGGEEKA